VDSVSDTNTTPGRLSLVNVTMLSVVLRAFGMMRPQIVGAPDWLGWVAAAHRLRIIRRASPAYHSGVTSVVRRFSRAGRLGSLPELLRALPPRQLVWFWVAILSTCSMFGFVVDIMVRGRQPVVLLVLTVIVSGLLGVGYAMVSMPLQPRRMVAVMSAHAAYVGLVPRLFPVLPATPNGRLLFDGMGSIVTVVVGYSSFLRFIDVTATRYLRAQAEIALARDIHRVLVPEIRRTVDGYEFFGWSVASGEVGGDLVDLVETSDGWLGYVADVSGHGVGAGVGMGMFKSSMRTRARSAGTVGDLLGDVHQVLMPLKQPNMYVTAACVRGGSDGVVDCAVAGHLPILRIRAGVVDEVTSPQLAIGMLDDATFTSRRVESKPGDLFAVLTDGLIEVFDGERRELGFDWAKEILGGSGAEPLSVVADRLIVGARNHGAQLDDQTLPLIRNSRA
jgi:serine phosphatase RsbU (regulator of sigma subunit)